MSEQHSHMRKKSHAPGKQTVITVLICFILLSAAAAAIRFSTVYNSSGRDILRKNDGKMEADLSRLSGDTYESVLISMHSTEPFREEDFAFFRGLDTVIASHTLLNTRELSEYLDCILRSENDISCIYLCLDPELLWINALGRMDNWQRSLTADLYSCINANPGISFEILLPYPYISYWLSFQQEDLDTLLSVYCTLVNELSAYPNTKTFFPGVEEWMMINPGNYDISFFDANEIVTQKLFLYTFCDSVYRITPENEEFFLDTLLSTVERERNTPTQYPDLSDWCIVFLGDSVLGNFSGSFSIPGYVSDLSGALSCNLAVGGTTGVFRYENGSDFLNIVDGILAANTAVQNGNNVFVPAGTTPEDFSYKKLCFIINYGFNDYFIGAPVDAPGNTASYKGSLRTGISRLKAVFPDADYILMSPTHTALFGSGTEINSEAGSVFPSYIEAAEELAAETDLYFLNHYDNFVVTEETMDIYLSDGTHPNERGRLAIAVSLMYFIEENVK